MTRTETIFNPIPGETVHHFLQTEVPLFAGFSDRAVARLRDECRPRHVARGEHLFYQGDAAASVYVVCLGWMIILLSSSDGRELVLSEMRRGDVFGENAVLTQVPRSATAQAREDTELLQIPGQTFLWVLDEEPRLARRLLALAAARLAASNERERALAFLPAEARIVRVLRTMDDIDRQTLDKGTISMSQDELALRTGLTRQTVARFLGEWRRMGWLLTGRGRIMLLNRPALYAVETGSEL